mmetsp:Transcript_18068/g.40062  ORF Transcript_18068/g.40062 Transcript_18068/m.40062 type:complete len:204 (+) Transcript_18068:579-1190(+)
MVQSLWGGQSWESDLGVSARRLLALRGAGTRREESARCSVERATSGLVGICRNMLMPCSAMMLDNSSLPALPHLAAYLACASPPFSPSTAARTVPGAERQSSSDAGCTILCARRSCAMAAPNSFSCVCSSARCSSTTAAAAAPPCSCTCAAFFSACSSREEASFSSSMSTSREPSLDQLSSRQGRSSVDTRRQRSAPDASPAR